MTDQMLAVGIAIITTGTGLFLLVALIQDTKAGLKRMRARIKKKDDNRRD